MVQIHRELLQKFLEYSAPEHDGEEFHSAAQNAYLVADAEAYYRAMYSSSADSWSLRDSHVLQTTRRLLNRGGVESKVIVWGHTTVILVIQGIQAWAAVAES